MRYQFQGLDSLKSVFTILHFLVYAKNNKGHATLRSHPLSVSAELAACVL